MGFVAAAIIDALVPSGFLRLEGLAGEVAVALAAIGALLLSQFFRRGWLVHEVAVAAAATGVGAAAQDVDLPREQHRA